MSALESEVYLETRTVFGEVPYEEALAHYMVQGDLWKEAEIHGRPWINYNLISAASTAPNGDVCIVRKNDTIPSNQRECFAVFIFDANATIWHELTPLSVETIKKPGKHDVIHLQISTIGGPEQANQGPHELLFSVNEEYGPEGAINLFHTKIYSGKVERIVDVVFDKRLDETNEPLVEANEHLADVIPIAPYREAKARQERDATAIGHAAVLNQKV